MPIKRLKDKERLLSKLWLPSAFSRHYWHAYLWMDRDALVANTIGMNDRTMACCVPAKWVTDFRTGQNNVPPMMGEFHFVKDDWSMMVVAHEVQHAIIHRMRVVTPFAWEAMAQDPITGGGYRGALTYEELLCFEAGRWVNDLYVWLWDFNPYGGLEGFYGDNGHRHAREGKHGKKRARKK